MAGCEEDDIGKINRLQQQPAFFTELSSRSMG
jgi:hypothetical protein